MYSLPLQILIEYNEYNEYKTEIVLKYLDEQYNQPPNKREAPFLTHLLCLKKNHHILQKLTQYMPAKKLAEELTVKVTLKKYKFGDREITREDGYYIVTNDDQVTYLTAPIVKLDIEKVKFMAKLSELDDEIFNRLLQDRHTFKNTSQGYLPRSFCSSAPPPCRPFEIGVWIQQQCIKEIITPLVSQIPFCLLLNEELKIPTKNSIVTTLTPEFYDHLPADVYSLRIENSEYNTIVLGQLLCRPEYGCAEKLSPSKIKEINLTVWEYKQAGYTTLLLFFIALNKGLVSSSKKNWHKEWVSMLENNNNQPSNTQYNNMSYFISDYLIPHFTKNLSQEIWGEYPHTIHDDKFKLPDFHLSYAITPLACLCDRVYMWDGSDGYTWSPEVLIPLLQNTALTSAWSLLYEYQDRLVTPLFMLCSHPYFINLIKSQPKFIESLPPTAWLIECYTYYTISTPYDLLKHTDDGSQLIEQHKAYFSQMTPSTANYLPGFLELAASEATGKRNKLTDPTLNDDAWIGCDEGIAAYLKSTIPNSPYILYLLAQPYLQENLQYLKESHILTPELLLKKPTLTTYETECPVTRQQITREDGIVYLTDAGTLGFLNSVDTLSKINQPAICQFSRIPIKCCVKLSDLNDREINFLLSPDKKSFLSTADFQLDEQKQRPQLTEFFTNLILTKPTSFIFDSKPYNDQDRDMAIKKWINSIDVKSLFDLIQQTCLFETFFNLFSQKDLIDMQCEEFFSLLTKAQWTTPITTSGDSILSILSRKEDFLDIIQEHYFDKFKSKKRCTESQLPDQTTLFNKKTCSDEDNNSEQMDRSFALLK